MKTLTLLRLNVLHNPIANRSRDIWPFKLEI